MPKKYQPKTPTTSTVRDGFTLEVDAETSARMAGVRQKGTKPELIVRRILRRLGIHYRVTNRDLPGSPDIANRRRKWAVFVHGCFWHRHPGCRLATTPTRNREFWLREMDFEVVTVWECETREPERLALRL